MSFLLLWCQSQLIVECIISFPFSWLNTSRHQQQENKCVSTAVCFMEFVACHCEQVQSCAHLSHKSSTTLECFTLGLHTQHEVQTSVSFSPEKLKHVAWLSSSTPWFIHQMFSAILPWLGQRLRCIQFSYLNYIDWWCDGYITIDTIYTNYRCL